MKQDFGGTRKPMRGTRVLPFLFRSSGLFTRVVPPISDRYPRGSHPYTCTVYIDVFAGRRQNFAP